MTTPDRLSFDEYIKTVRFVDDPVIDPATIEPLDDLQLYILYCDATGASYSHGEKAEAAYQFLWSHGFLTIMGDGFMGGWRPSYKGALALKREIDAGRIKGATWE